MLPATQLDGSTPAVPLSTAVPASASKKSINRKWKAQMVAEQEWTRVDGWVLPEVPPLITDILISMDDKYLYVSNWLRGDVVQYDITDPACPRVAGRIWLGGILVPGGGLHVTGGLPDGLQQMPAPPCVQGVTLRGGPQMLQLSLDGK